MIGDELIIAAHAIGGFLNHRQLSLAQRCAVATQAGFRQIGWALDDYRRERHSGSSDADIRAILKDYGVTVAEIEFVKFGVGQTAAIDWSVTGDELLRFASVVRPRHLVCAAGWTDETAADLGMLAEAYGLLCRRASDIGVLALIEPMPWSRLSTIGAAADIAAMAGAPNGGIVLDTWHFHRAGETPAAIAKVPADVIRLVQVSDAAAAEGDAFEDTVMRRLFPGQGGFDLVGVFGALRDHGVDAPVSVEVIGEVSDRMTAAAMAEASFASTIDILRRAAIRAAPLG